MNELMSSSFLVANGTIPDEPVIVEGFDVDNDVLKIENLGITRSDLQFTQIGADTVVSLVSGEQLAIVTNTFAFDFDPVSLLKTFYAALAAKDIDKVLETLSVGVVWEVPGPTDQMPWAGKWSGHSGVRDYFDNFSKGIIEENLEPVQFIAQGNIVAVVLNGSGRSQKGVAYKGGVVHWIYVRDGKIDHLQYYLDTFPVQEALQGGRPFTISPAPQPDPYYVVKPLPSIRTTDSIVLDSSVFETPPSTVVAVRAMYAALQGLNVPEVRKVFAPSVVWDIFGPKDLLSWAGERIGPDAAAESANQIIDTMHFDHFKPTHMIYEGDTAAIIIDEGGTSTVTGLPFKTSVVHIVVANDEGKVTLFKNYINTAWIVEAFLGGRPYTVS
jgi:ketosteroid isomerase-like protein